MGAFYVDGNPHAHVMTTLRTLGQEGHDQRIRSYISRSKEIIDLRFSWAVVANAALEQAGFEQWLGLRQLVDGLNKLIQRAGVLLQQAQVVEPGAADRTIKRLLGLVGARVSVVGQQ